MNISRRDFIRTAACAPFLAGYRLLAEPEKGRYQIRDVQSMVLAGPRTYTLVRVVASNGVSGIAEAYGSPAIGVKEQILELKPLLVGKDPLGIDALYTHLGEGGKSLSGTRTDGSAHSLMRAASGIEMALWDLAGRLLGQPVTTLLGGRFRDRVRVYDHEAPKNMLDKTSCREWAAKTKEGKSGFTAHKFGFPHTSESQDGGRDPGNRVLSTKEIIDLGHGYENCREAIGWDHDNHGSLPLGIRSAHVYSDRRSGSGNETLMARRSAAGGLLGILETAGCFFACSDLHG